MKLFLVQHGVAKSEAEDPQRGLNEEGRRSVERMAELLKSLHLDLQRIEYSEKLRARQTGEILAASLQPVEGTKEITGLAPMDDVELVRARLQEASENLMLVGHLPHLSRLTSRLLGQGADQPLVQFQMGGVLRLDRDDSGQWLVRWMLVPELFP
ncbi:MAG: phosphohistidine phosphatase SixA [Acidobacteria bacterium]|nr:phosphohistidine phosphatase SixA [Acidobacteriota bacterium]